MDIFNFVDPTADSFIDPLLIDFLFIVPVDAVCNILILFKRENLNTKRKEN